VTVDAPGSCCLCRYVVVVGEARANMYSWYVECKLAKDVVLSDFAQKWGGKETRACTRVIIVSGMYVHML
jgi:hypothetical protein